MKKYHTLAGSGIHNKSVKNDLLALLYPPRCVCCDRILGVREGGCCSECAARLPWISGPSCMKCGKPVETQEQEYCEDCRRYPHEFDRGAAAFTYTGMMRRSVYRMKHENRRDYLSFYAEAMVHALAGELMRWRPEVIIPVPMHPRKRRRRGYNQSELLAEHISRLTGIPMRKDLLRCVKLTSSQKLLDRKARMQNLKGSIEASENFPKLRSVLLVDDVYTTGSTMDEMAGVLKRAGAEHVFFVVLCSGKGKKAVCTAENL
ncbi:MAG: ComF family protein [Lachnospiraceae bacterium]|nr:ComF family protein [Lachnospiraceae bacterium]